MNDTFYSQFCRSIDPPPHQHAKKGTLSSQHVHHQSFSLIITRQVSSEVLIIYLYNNLRQLSTQRNLKFFNLKKNWSVVQIYQLHILHPV